MQPRDVVDTTAGALSKEDKVKALIEDLMDKLPEQFNMPELMSKVNVARRKATRFSCDIIWRTL